MVSQMLSQTCGDPVGAGQARRLAVCHWLDGAPSSEDTSHNHAMGGGARVEEQGDTLDYVLVQRNCLVMAVAGRLGQWLLTSWLTLLSSPSFFASHMPVLSSLLVKWNNSNTPANKISRVKLPLDWAINDRFRPPTISWSSL